MASEIEQLDKRMDSLETQLKAGHYCIQQKDIGKILGIMTNIIKEFYGNGNEGISKTIPRLEMQIGSLIEISAGQATSISALAKAMAEVTTISDYKEKEKLSSRQQMTIWITGIIGGSAVVISLLNFILK